MLLTIGKFAIVAALAFAGGVLLGRQHPPKSALIRQYEQSIKNLQTKFAATSTPSAICGQPSIETKLAIRKALDELTAGPWATSDDFDAVYVAVVTSKASTPALFNYPVGEPGKVRAVNAAARQATILPPGESSELGNEAIDCLTP